MFFDEMFRGNYLRPIVSDKPMRPEPAFDRGINIADLALHSRLAGLGIAQPGYEH